MGTAEIKTRDQIRAEDKWDLSSLFASEAEWEKALADMNSTIPTLSRFKGTLGQSAEKLARENRRAARYVRPADKEHRISRSRQDFQISFSTLGMAF